MPLSTELPADWQAMEKEIAEREALEKEVNRELSSSRPWPQPRPLPPIHEPPAAFDLELLPEAFREHVADTSARLSCPPDFVAIPLMVSAAAALGRGLAIRPKSRDSWFEVANLWGAVIAPPSSGKSPAMATALEAMEKIEANLTKENETERSAHAKRVHQYEERLRVAREKFRNAAKKGESGSGVDWPESPGEAMERRLLVSGTTPEKLISLNSQNGRGLLAVWDELSGLLAEMGKAGREGQREFLLAAATGKTPFRADTLSRGRDFVPAACLSIVGGIQPGPFAENLLATGTGDGLLQRFSLLVWPEATPYIYNDTSPNEEARARAHAVIERLWEVNFGGEQIGEVEEPGAVPFLRFFGEAAPAFREWLESFMNRLASEPMPEAMQSHLSKYRKALPTLALLFEVIDNPRPDCVSLESWHRAERWGRYLESHLRKIYGTARRPEVVAARAIGERISAGDLPHEFSTRSIYEKGWKHLGEPETVRAGLKAMAACGLVREVVFQTGGRPSERWEVNPRADFQKGGEA